MGRVSYIYIGVKTAGLRMTTFAGPGDTKVLHHPVGVSIAARLSITGTALETLPLPLLGSSPITSGQQEEAAEVEGKTML